MSETNTTTLQTYEAHIQEYIDGTPQEVSGDVKDWIDATLDGLPNEARIIEIGSAFGRDAAYIEALGYIVLKTDATEGFVRLLKDRGHQAKGFNLITDDFDTEYDLVFADAVLLHFTRDELIGAVHKVYGALNPKGRFSFTLKNGEGESWSEDKLGAPRYFCYWKEPQITEVLVKSGFSQIEVFDDSSEHNSAKWLHIIATK